MPGEPNRGRRRALVDEPKQCRTAWGLAGSLFSAATLARIRTSVRPTSPSRTLLDERPLHTLARLLTHSVVYEYLILWGKGCCSSRDCRHSSNVSRSP